MKVAGPTTPAKTPPPTAYGAVAAGVVASGARLAVMLAAIALAGSQADAQRLGGPRAPSQPVARDQPVYYQADTATYDRDAGLITLTGHVEFWQNDRVLLADRITYDSTTKVAAAAGHVVILEPDGQTVFSDYAELTEGMKDGVLSGMQALLAENGRLVANGARRTDGRINELSRAVYSTCDLCAQDPTRPPLWQIRAREAVQDLDNKRIEYRDAVIDIFGQPVAWFPYLTHPDPSVKRASGVLVPSFGISKHLGGFLEVPYYVVLNAQSDATITPVIATKNGPALDLQYRRRFNTGSVTVNTSIANELGDAGGHVFAKGQFAWDDTWRYGFDINRASSINYMRDFRIAGTQDVLTSQVYIEGFGQGAYTRLDSRLYQGLTTSISSAKLPFVLPRYVYDFVGQPDALGGRFSLNAGAFNVLRNQGTNTQRGSLRLDWQRPAIGQFGDMWNLTLHADAATYFAHQLDQQPNYASIGTADRTQAMPTVAVDLRWPLARSTGSGTRAGTQIIEPILQLVAAPRSVSTIASRVPNEDSLDLEFTDASLFQLNRYPGIDRLEGGLRANAALHAAWYMPDGGVLDGLVGQSYRTRRDSTFPTGSGLENTVSDVVSHLTYTPSQYLDITTRQRFDRKTWNVKLADAIVSTGPSDLRLSAGYIYTTTNPYLLYDTPPAQSLASSVVNSPRNEITLGASTSFGRYRLSANGRRDLQTSKMVGLGVAAAYEDECFIFDVRYYQRYTSINNDRGSSTILFQITFKTVGQFGFHAL